MNTDRRSGNAPREHTGKQNTADRMADRIRTGRKQAGLSQKELGEKLGVTRNTVINWEAGKYRPDADLFPQLCAALQISLNELFGMNPAAQLGVSEQEWKLLAGYRQITPFGRKIADRVIAGILEEEQREHARKLVSGVRLLDLVSTAAAAGDGYEYSDIPVEDYRFVYANARNLRANGMIRVKGDSMLPVYRDGDLVYVEYTNLAEPGEDVLCSSVAGMHIKRLGEDGVYSLNKEYPFTLTSPDDHVRIIGKILGVVASSDCPGPEDCDALEELRHDEIAEYRKAHGLS